MKSTTLTIFAFLFNLGALYILMLMLPFGQVINVWFKLLFAFLFTTAEVLACTAAYYVVQENRPSRKAEKPAGNN